MTVFLPALIAIIGVLLYAFTQGKLSEVGRILFWVGLLVFLLRGDQLAVVLK